ncbi:hypothetical protein PR048_019681 [Dryococelus australis]|uniref:Uncharacterized protein n=1 Tax=Dryococelus australis TaxID=614101 RepID=A0ABQ9H446_9NEOP|nr:hypothetical protein PR048_019681 [Dryococelus australis]
MQRVRRGPYIGTSGVELPGRPLLPVPCEGEKKAVLNIPKGPRGQIFYLRKLAVYNPTVYSLANQDGVCYLWNELEGKRGAVEIVTCVCDYVMNQQNIEEVRMMSDGCGGQQKNEMQIKRTSGRPSTTQGATKAYNEILSITAPKYKDLCTMRDKLIIPRGHHAYYRALKSDEGVRDAMPEPDYDESEEEFT